MNFDLRVFLTALGVTVSLVSIVLWTIEIFKRRRIMAQVDAENIVFQSISPAFQIRPGGAIHLDSPEAFNRQAEINQAMQAAQSIQPSNEGMRQSDATMSPENYALYRQLMGSTINASDPARAAAFEALLNSRSPGTLAAPLDLTAYNALANGKILTGRAQIARLKAQLQKV